MPDHLPVVEEVIEPEPVKAAPEKWGCIAQEVIEQLDYEPARFLRRRTIRKKYVSLTHHELTPVIATLPECLQERGIAAPGLLAHISVAKYCDHLPLYRQEQIFAQRRMRILASVVYRLPFIVWSFRCIREHHLTWPDKIESRPAAAVSF